MTARRRLAVAAALSGLTVVATPSVAGAALAITAPPIVDVGTAPARAGTLSAQLGTVTVTATGLTPPSFTAAVSSTNFTTGGGTAAETVPTSSVSYWSGPATATSGAQSAVPGQMTSAEAQALSIPRTAFTSTGLVLSISASWNATIVVRIPAAVVAGSYTGTITHSVA